MKVPELTENTIVIGRNRKKSSQFLLFVIFGLFLFGRFLLRPDFQSKLFQSSYLFLTIMIILIVFMFIGMIIMSLIRIISKRPGLIIDDTTIYDLVMGGQYELCDIDYTLIIYQPRLRNMLSLILKDGRIGMHKLNRFQKITKNLNRYRKHEICYLSPDWLNCDIYELKGLIDMRLSEFNSVSSIASRLLEEDEKIKG